MSVAATSACHQSDSPSPAGYFPAAPGRVAARVLEVLSAAADSAGLVEMPLSEIARRMDSSPRQVRRCLRQLDAAGLVSLVRKAQSAGRHSAAVYRLDMLRDTTTGAGVLSQRHQNCVTTSRRGVI